MPNYTRNIPDAPSGPSLPIRRTPAYSPLVAIITTDDLIGTYTHYYKGRTVPCESPDCEPCQNGMPYRWHAYVAAWETKTGLHFIFEVTAAGAEPFIDYRDHHGTLRGCLFSARRLKQQPNGRVLIQTKPADLREIRLPKSPDMSKCLSILWSLSETRTQPVQHEPEKRTPQVSTGQLPHHKKDPDHE